MIKTMQSMLQFVSDMFELSLPPVARQVKHERLTYLNVIKLRRLVKAMHDIERHNVIGDIVEFGVALGGSAIILAEHAKAHGRSFHGFDVFSTIPPPTSHKDDEKSKRRYDVIKSGASLGINGDEYYGYKDKLFEDVSTSFARHEVPVDGQRISLHKGLFEETWPTAGVGAASLVHIDCDWYDPVAYCLEAVSDILSPGGIIVLDDYHDYGGARTAVDEFVSKRQNFMLQDGRNPFLRKL